MNWATYFWIVIGILVSLIMPVVRDLAKPPVAGTKGLTAFVQRIWPVARPYFFMGLFSLMAALVILAGVSAKKLNVDSNGGAFLLGYFSDSTIQKLKPS